MECLANQVTHKDLGRRIWLRDCFVAFGWPLAYLLLSSLGFNESFIGQHVLHQQTDRENEGEDSDNSERAVERLRKDVHGLGAAVRTLGEKIGVVPFFYYFHAAF